MPTPAESKHQWTLVTLRQIDEEFSARRSYFNLGPFFGLFMQEARNKTLWFLLYADAKVVFTGRVGKTVVAHGRLTASIRDAHRDILTRLEQRQSAAICGLQDKKR